MHIARIQAIFEKDLKDFLKNTMTIFMPPLPIFLAFLYSRMGDGMGEAVPLMIVYIVVGITYSAVTAGSMMMLMAEENEKKTLRGLIMSPASYIEIIIGKSLVTFLMTFISLVLSLIIMGSKAMMEPQHILGLLLLFLFFLFLGIGVGLFVKTVGMTTAYLMPMMFIFGFTPMIDFLGLSEGSLIMKVASYLPLSQLIEMADTGSWVPIGIVLIWTLAAALFAFICFQRVKKDRA